MATNIATSESGKLFPFDGAQVAFSPRSRSLLLLNDSAALIWQCFERGESPAAAAEALVAQFSIAPDLAERDAKLGYNALEQQQRIALRRAESGTDEDWFGHRMMVGNLEERSAVHPPDLVITLFDQRIGLIIPDDLREALRSVLRDHVTAPAGDSALLEVKRSGATVSVDGAGALFAQPRTLSEAMPLICQAVFATALKRAGFALVIHAACVRRGDRTFLLPGLSGSGKSTLTAALGRSGFEIVADDTTVFLATHGTVCPSAFWLSIKQGSYQLLRDLYPELASLPESISRDRVLRLLPNVGLSSSRSSITDIVFPSYRGPSDGSALYQPIGKAEALLRLTECGYWFPMGISPDEVGRFLTFVERTPCGELHCSSLENSIALFERLARE